MANVTVYLRKDDRYRVCRRYLHASCAFILRPFQQHDIAHVLEFWIAQIPSYSLPTHIDEVWDREKAVSQAVSSSMREKPTTRNTRSDNLLTAWNCSMPHVPKTPCKVWWDATYMSKMPKLKSWMWKVMSRSIDGWTKTPSSIHQLTCRIR